MKAQENACSIEDLIVKQNCQTTYFLLNFFHHTLPKWKTCCRKRTCNNWICSML